MKPALVIAIVPLVSLIACSADAPSSPIGRADEPLTNDGPHQHPEIWNLTPTFSDDFDGTFLDPAKWSSRYPGSDQDFGERRSFEVVDGTVRLRLREGQGPASSHIGTGNDGGGSPHRPRFEQKYGWFEIRAKMPQKRGFVSAFWLWQMVSLPEGGLAGQANRPNPFEPDEIDIFEQYSNNKHGNRHTLHYGQNPNGGIFNDPRHWVDNFSGQHEADLSGDFHVYAADWRPNSVSFYVDGELVGRSNRSPQKKMYVLLDLYRRPEVAGPNPPHYDDAFTIDYVRVYQLKNPGLASPPTSNVTPVATTCTLENPLPLATPIDITVPILNEMMIDDAAFWTPPVFAGAETFVPAQDRLKLVLSEARSNGNGTFMAGASVEVAGKPSLSLGFLKNYVPSFGGLGHSTKENGETVVTLTDGARPRATEQKARIVGNKLVAFALSVPPNGQVLCLKSGTLVPGSVRALDGSREPP
jgi:beta-glucanase (GH16 family)